MQQNNFNKKLFVCKCGFSRVRSRKAIHHLEQIHEIKELDDGDHHLSYYGKFICTCTNVFTSDIVTIIYKDKKIFKLGMNCLRCHLSTTPTLKINSKYLSDDVVALLCRWKLTQKRIQGFEHFNVRGRSHNHQSEECQACILKLCGNSRIPNETSQLNVITPKIFMNNSHQVKLVNNIFEILSIEDSLNSEFSMM